MLVSPRLNYQKLHAPDMGRLAELVRSEWFQRSAAFAVAQMAFNGADKIQMEGAKSLIDQLESLANDKLDEIPKMPDKSLTTYGALTDKPLETKP